MNEKVNRIIYQFWTGDNPITENRMAGIRTLGEVSGVECRLIRKDDISDISDLHPAYEYLSEVHKSDYLRCYFMHNYGGGYADIKYYSAENNWKQMFDKMDGDGNLYVIGQPEIERGSPIPGYNEPDKLCKLCSNSYFIVRPHTPFTEMWWSRLNLTLDEKMEALKKNPATWERERGHGYPLRWAEIMGEIFHECCMRFYGEGRVSRELVTGREWREYK